MCEEKIIIHSCVREHNERNDDDDENDDEEDRIHIYKRHWGDMNKEKR